MFPVGKHPGIEVDDYGILGERPNLSSRFPGMLEALEEIVASPVNLVDRLILVTKHEGEELFLGEGVAECQACRLALFHGLREPFDVIIMPV